jgi:hypothetical protein
VRRHGTTRGFAWMHGDRLVNWTKELATRSRPDLADPPIALKLAKKEQRIVAVRVITESEFQRLVKRALANDTYDLFQRRQRKK